MITITLLQAQNAVTVWVVDKFQFRRTFINTPVRFAANVARLAATRWPILCSDNADLVLSCNLVVSYKVCAFS